MRRHTPRLHQPPLRPASQRLASRVAAVAIVASTLAIGSDADTRVARACVWDSRTAAAASEAAPDLADLLAGGVAIPSAAYWQWRLDADEADALEQAAAWLSLGNAPRASRVLEGSDIDLIAAATAGGSDASLTSDSLRLLIAVEHALVWPDLDTELQAQRPLRAPGPDSRWDTLADYLARADAPLQYRIEAALWRTVLTSIVTQRGAPNETPRGIDESAVLRWLMAADDRTLGQGWRMRGERDRPLASRDPGETYLEAHRRAFSRQARDWLWLDGALPSAGSDVSITSSAVIDAVAAVLRRGEPELLAPQTAPVWWALLGTLLAIEKNKPLAFRAFDRARRAIAALTTAATIGGQAGAAPSITELDGARLNVVWTERLASGAGWYVPAAYSTLDQRLQTWMNEVRSGTRTDHAGFAPEAIARERGLGAAYREAFARYEETAFAVGDNPLEPARLAAWHASMVEAGVAARGVQGVAADGDTPLAISIIAASLAVGLGLILLSRRRSAQPAL